MWPGAHPRSRGENGCGLDVLEVWGGSSPLTRGKPVQDLSATFGRRLIPAHAGKTHRLARTAQAHPAHPRSRGENSNSHTFVSPLHGSSPLTRGKHPDLVVGARGCGLIPAHAGKTMGGRSTRYDIGAHPRSRGENTKSQSWYHWYHGSSPLTRGKPAAGEDRRRRPGLIPAHAGKTMRCRHPAAQGAAHPRSRGENGVAVEDAVGQLGSSPLTRGKHEPPPPRKPGHGLIPAHAGKTIPSVAARATARAHPRSRGENAS